MATTKKKLSGNTPVKPKWKKPTLKQLKVVKEISENLGNKTKEQILLDAWYSESVAKTPEIVFWSKAILQAFEKGWLSDEYLMEKHKEHLNAKRIETKEMYSYSHDEYDDDPEWVFEQIEYDISSDLPWAKVLSIAKMWGENKQYLRVRFSIPDYIVQDRSLDKAYKVKGSYAPEKHEHTGEISLLSLFKK